MFRLYQQAFLAALEDWGNLSKKLQTEKETIQTIMNSMSQAWVGETQRDNENIYKDLVTTGLYQQTAEIVEKVYRIQYDELPNIIAQMARCEKMGEQLLEDSYMAPYLGGFGYYNDGYLTLDDSYVGAFNSAVTEVLEQAMEARNIIYEAMDACDGLIDFGSERDMLEAGYRKVKRIENFSQEFNKYVIEVKEIEETLISKFRAIIAEDPDPANRKWNLIMQNLNNKGNTGYTLQPMKSVKTNEKSIRTEKQNFVLSYEEQQYIREDIKALDPNAILKELFPEEPEAKIQYMMALKNKLDVPADKWTFMDMELLSSIYLTAIEEKNTELLNFFMKCLLVEERGDMTLFVSRDVITQTQVVNDPSAYYKGEYSAHLDMEKCNKILAYTDPKTQGEAYYTLTRIINYGGYTGTIQYGVYTDESKRGAELEFYVEDGVLKFQSTFLLGDDNGRNKMGFEVTNLYEELGEEAITNMTELNFTDEAITQILAQVATDKDKEYVFELMKASTQGDYQTLFAKNPDKLSLSGQNALTTYAYGLYANNITLDEEGKILSEDYTQLTTLLNAMMTRTTKISSGTGLDGMTYPIVDLKSNYSDEYLSILSVCTKELLDTNSCLVELNYDNLDKQLLYTQYQIKNMYTLVESLRQMESYYSSGNIFENILNLFSDQSTTISDLKMRSDNICDAQFTYNISTNRMSIEAEKLVSMVELSSIDPQTAEQKEEVNTYYAKVVKAREAERDANLKIALDTLAFICPKIEKITDKLEYLIDEPDRFDIAKEANDFVVKDEKKNKAVGTGIGIAKSYYSAYEDVQKAYAEREAAYNEILDDMYEDAALMYVDDWGNINIAQGMYDPEQIVKKAMFDNNGYSLLAADEQNVKDGTDAIKACKDEDANVLNRHFNPDACEKGVLPERTDEEKMEILHLYWSGPKTDADRELLASIANDEKQLFMDTLSDILIDTKIEFKYSGTSMVSMYEAYKVDLR